jgi:hypothetical protein
MAKQAPVPALQNNQHRSHRWIPAAIFALLSLVIYADVLFDSGRLPASPGTDLDLQFLSWRAFGFGHLSQGNIPLWNPHIFGGTPYMASFQSALFYPLNWLHLIMPLGLAISWYYAIHTFLMGLTTSLWARYRGAGLAGQITSGVMMMFSGQYFLHGYAGHLPHLAVMVWVPVIFMATDALADGKRWTWALAGAAALALEVLGGHPQYVFYTGITLGLYALCRLIASRYRLRMAAGLLMMGMLAMGISAIQLLPGIAAARENVRIGGLPYEMASQFSVGPEQWLTLLAPYVYGHLHSVAGATSSTSSFYLGYGYLWELSFFVSITGLLLACIGLARTGRTNRITSIIIIALLCAISAGSYLPLHPLLYDHLPFFGSFRVPAKFMFFVSLLLAMLASEGVTVLAREPQWRGARIAGRAAAILAAIVLLTCGILLIQGEKPGGLWNWVFNRLAHAPDRFSPRVFTVPEFRSAGLKIAAVALFGAAATLLLLAWILIRVRQPKLRTAGLVTLCLVEMTVVAAIGRDASPLQLHYYMPWAQAQADNPERWRCVHGMMGYENTAMSIGTYDLWGYDPGVLRRYAQLVTASQGKPADAATQYLSFLDFSSTRGLYRMFRLRWAFATTPELGMVLFDAPLPQAQLVGAAAVVPDRDAMFTRLLSPTFNPTTLVYLEKAPKIAPAGHDVSGYAHVVGQDTDEMLIEAQCSAPAILLVTDNYAQGWKASGLPGSVQQEYEVMPANYCLRAIPLAAGKHELLLEYSPPGWAVGKQVSAVSLVVFLAASLASLRWGRKKASEKKAV